ncbi:CaiB/BaiF CoA transferase family protein [Halopseudomonas sp.]|jgi:alpha-methylacyl-CoA racemase|uniref:CaiB/BaiF CoA transferase family protein n=1 Tax=Halopseudomonas sp. TaxID=2901191 RepID=UPI001A3D8FB1|nr:CoA transferase [Pseudomonas sp.]|tara:strand:- start:1738 stop:2853 length:1116 start_codon:yes stop_codon:yes gene_type:complete
MSGPLKGKRVIEMVGLGPAPFCGMMLADMGAEVIRIDRPNAGHDGAWKYDILSRNRATVCLDLKQPEGVEAVLKLVEKADALIEGFRPGVMEKIGLGPDECLARNPALVFGRMTGWGQYGPLSQAAGHDMNYIAISGALHAIGRANEAPVVPLNLVGDFGGGGMLLTVGVLAAMLEAGKSGKGQVVDAAMTDGAALLSSMMYGFNAMGQWSNNRGENLLDGGAHFYDVYTCADGKYVAVAAIEPKFYAELLERCGLQREAFEPQMDPRQWPMLKLKLADVFKARTRDEWCEILEGTDACFAPVLDWDEAPLHPHNQARHTFVESGGYYQPAPAPRFSRTPSAAPAPPAAPLANPADILSSWGLPEDLIRAL